jgi:hypothetical protein
MAERRDLEQLAARLGMDPIELELHRAFADSLSTTLLAAFRAWCAENLPKTSGPNDLFIGLGMFLQDAFAAVWQATTVSQPEQAAYLRQWWQVVREGLPARQAELGVPGARGHERGPEARRRERRP